MSTDNFLKTRRGACNIKKLVLPAVIAGCMVMGATHQLQAQSYEVQYYTFPVTETLDASEAWSNADPYALTLYSLYPTGNIGQPLSSINSQSGESDGELEPGIMSEALFYPNPWRLSEGAELGYRLSQDMTIEIRIYNIFAQEVFRKTYPAGTQGGLGITPQDPFIYNTVQFNRNSFNRELSAGVYFFVLIYNDRVLTKGKFAIKP